MIWRPLEAEAVHATFIDVLPAVTVTFRLLGAPGLLYGITLEEGDETEPDPAPLVAATVNVYEIP